MTPEPSQYPFTPASTRAAVPDAARRFIDRLCDFDVDEAAEGLCEDALLTIGGQSYAAGKTRVRSALVRALSLVYSIRCEPAVVWIRRNVAIIEADVDCERVDRARVAFPLTVTLRFRNHLISDIRLLTYEPAVTGWFAASRDH